jgi:Holliday junction DNA helicase RuvA
VIASVRGEVMVRRPNYVVLEAGGVGYRLAVSAETLKAVPSRGKQATLHAHLVAREDSLSLYGFASEEERDLFLYLTSVSGIGPKVAIAILSGGPPRELLRAIAAGDAKRFQSAPGVGKRTAERLIVELREKVAGELTEGIPAAGDSSGEAEPRLLAREGLMHLGYTLTEAEALLDGAEGSTVEEMINAALRGAAQGSGART